MNGFYSSVPLENEVLCIQLPETNTKYSYPSFVERKISLEDDLESQPGKFVPEILESFR